LKDNIERNSIIKWSNLKSTKVIRQDIYFLKKYMNIYYER